MKYFNTGKGRITLLTLLAIWSISLVVDLPGLAISPIMSEMDRIFPHASHLEIQLLSVLPNFCIFPFILLSGKLSESKDKLRLIILGLAIFLISGVACFLARSMVALIVISCFIGIGCGIVIPLAAGVIADNFVGVERMKQMGIKSGIANFSLIIATLVVGWMGTSDWHLPFIVYLLPIVPLCLAPFLSQKYMRSTASPSQFATVAPHPADPDKVEREKTVAHTAADPKAKLQAATEVHTAVAADSPLVEARSSAKSRRRTVWGIMLLYFTITCCTLVVTYFVPFVMQDYHMPDSWTSIVTAIFFLTLTLAGFVLAYVVKGLKNQTSWICLAMLVGGLLLLAVSRSLAVMIIAAAMLGFGSGVLQPIFYNKASLLAPTSSQATRILSYVMTANYFGTAVAPFIFIAIKDVFHIPGHVYTFWLAAGFMTIALLLSLIRRRSFVFFTSIDDC